ncbi:MAG TPA: NAD(P)/FAD-dependent oxidoreductase [Vicinamibacteria bacterium]|nr:NAD(P)/FAD-dependent oxidoreductase [Vicinamibacteria bacterium]
MRTSDIKVVGGGPAGASVALRLSQLGFSVTLSDESSSRRQHVIESLPSSIRIVFEALGLELPPKVLVKRPPEHRVYWGEVKGGFPWKTTGDEASFLVSRRAFDAFLREAAEAAGVEWISTRDTVRGTHPFIIDASGRAGLLARPYRIYERARTLALTAHFGTKEPSPPTVIEAFDEGFVWSAPLPNGLRDVTIFVDAESGREPYDLLLARAPNSAALVADAPRVSPVNGTDATPYASRRYCGPDFLLVGDAASFLDPLSAHGVHKAMDGALVAAAVARTILERPSSASLARLFYEDREDRIYRTTSERLKRLYAQETRFPTSLFWRRRCANLRGDDRASRPSPRPLTPTMKLRAAEGVRIVEGPVLENDFIVSREVLLAPDTERPVRYWDSICLPDLFREVITSSDVGRVAGTARFPVDLALGAIDWLYRSGYLIVES